MKKIAYIGLFGFLGVLVSTLLHGVIELTAIHFLLADFSQYNLGLSWSQWLTVHLWGSIVLWILGLGIGIWQGVYWWEKLYEESRVN